MFEQKPLVLFSVQYICIGRIWRGLEVYVQLVVFPDGRRLYPYGKLTISTAIINTNNTPTATSNSTNIIWSFNSVRSVFEGWLFIESFRTLGFQVVYQFGSLLHVEPVEVALRLSVFLP